MVSADRLVAFAAMSLVLLAIPGPSVLFLIGRALAHGRRTALATIVGSAIGAYILVIAVAFGVGAIVERSVIAFTVLKWAGAGYLIYLGVKALRQGRSLRTAIAGESVAHPGLRSMWEGLAVEVGNPKTIMFFVAVLPQFVDRGAGHATVQMLVLGLVFTLLGLLSDSVWGLAASMARDWFGRSPRRLSMVGGAGGLTMIGLGVAVAVTGRND
ncbi:LysE family translocator [Nocardia arthritidis]|uniref:LysE family translocator n=1 Tax=Nocardia arthritidis TaxID=228602 RepID=A0A6G9YAP8_9NOCA|nr:LysE family translocator [Nocardia arthritidis]QIS10157.1 LysE family translocator [Nocardia arthritidis]